MNVILEEPGQENWLEERLKLQAMFAFLKKSQEKDVLLEKLMSSLWQKIMGHINFDNLVKINKNQAMKGMPKITKPSSNMCRHCQHANQTHVGFKTKLFTSSKPLEIIHTDLCGPTRCQNLQGESYFIIFVDNYTRMAWVAFLKHKSKAFDHFKSFKALVENENGKRIKC